MSRRPFIRADVARDERLSPLDPDIARLVEGIALTLAAEHHALEIAQGLSRQSEIGSDGPSSHGPS
jgi:hypothetical protein